MYIPSPICVDVAAAQVPRNVARHVIWLLCDLILVSLLFFQFISCIQFIFAMHTAFGFVTAFIN